ncbi:hypothetical protein NGA_0646200 [Nannochloropsis gaditana CCMP526]|uniref:uncharacterized protein n=1 Tax=Nannochloropsis gaditana (strain CCMP526) TaxID=1093141 RepID=UPI00029F7BD6|nr:hypothetical protein NGA_0646200 [Nannochloropsis gaditana CCMP526]EKU20713.1 hypothetical protein NGA_0646200 [Nannochloropsis gaditana CCMP526]|eukprot:XP_005855647.1 hypothetical protein NGA_0646200 [Nannochloropsis gaditana CCMP526]
MRAICSLSYTTDRIGIAGIMRLGYLCCCNVQHIHIKFYTFARSDQISHRSQVQAFKTLIERIGLQRSTSRYACPGSFVWHMSLIYREPTIW